MAEGLEEWINDSNEVLNLQLVRTPLDTDLLQRQEEQLVEEFNPTFTYPIFGDSEKVFGYKDLDIKLRFASGSLRQYLEIKYNEKLSSETTPADDIEATLYKFIPPDYTKSGVEFKLRVAEDAEKFKPLGEKLDSYIQPSLKGKGKRGDRTTELGNKEDAVLFEIYKANWNTPGFREYHRRMQLFILLFIEGGSYVHEDEDAWEFITLYERRQRPETGVYTHHFVGYISVYPFWCYPDRVRLRLSQFVVLPPYQHQGHGSKLYSALFQHMLARPEVAELTVEDPAEAFEDLRDRNDLRFLVKEGILDNPMLLVGIGDGKRDSRNEWERSIRKKYKIAQRQFDRLLEMLLLRQLNNKDPAQIKAYRLHVKARLYRFNYEMLCQMTPGERKEALAKTYQSVVEDYERILDMTFG
ncbi:histone acetyltransferase type B catalytic subunit [Cryptococcus depauperatus CBS 7841]|uniref:Histone acetyltransferase type B catalytic subunit n=1 Tax=Cryptococcus depauperatus CBS 7841 TaxID=1295531 RepID=A0A1E3IBR7_9TREE|nr:histone acetyltransferase type B catalytic subunit [Cryptococcus depauperatus CBS 7841]